MANQIINNSIITRNALALYRNKNALVKTIRQQYDSQFAQTGAKIGATLNIRLPNDFVLRRGAIAAPQGITERTMPLTIQPQNGVDFGFSTAERTLKVDDFNKRYTAPAVNTILGGVAQDIMSMTLGFANLVRNADPTTGLTLAPTANTWLRANAKLTKQHAPDNDRWAILDPDADAATVSGLMGLFNPSGQIGRQTTDGTMAAPLLGLDGWMQDQTVITVQTGSYNSAATVSAVPAQGSGTVFNTTLQCTAINGGLNVGDVVTIDGVYQVNRITKASYFTLMQFPVVQVAASGATSIVLGLPLIGPKADVGDGTGTAAAFQNIAALPTVGATIRLVGSPGEVVRRNLVYPSDAMTLACVDLELIGGGVVDEGRESLDGCSMRTVTYYTGTVDQKGTRLDMMYGWLLLRPEWSCVVTSPVSV